MLEQVCGIEISDTDFTDDRLAIVLRQLSQEDTWQSIEQTLSRNTVRIYALPVQRVRLDATTMSKRGQGDKGMGGQGENPVDKFIYTKMVKRIARHGL